MPKTYGTAGPRLIMPTICTSVPLASCSVEAQLLFERLITQADDQGRLQGEARVVAALCLPLVAVATERAVRRWLGELATATLIVRYVADGRELVQLAGWWDNQGTPRRAYPSRYPAPDGWQDRIRVDGTSPPDRGQPADNSPRNDGEVPPGRGETAASPAPTRAGPNPSRPSPSSTRPVPPDAPDAADSLYRRTGRYPSKPTLDWLTDLASEAGGSDAPSGESRLAALIDSTSMEGGTLRDYLNGIRDRLRAENHAADKREAEEERQRLAEKRAKPTPLRPAPTTLTREEEDAELRAYFAREEAQV